MELGGAGDSERFEPILGEIEVNLACCSGEFVDGDLGSAVVRLCGGAGLTQLMLNIAWIRDSKLKLAEEAVAEVVGPARNVGPSRSEEIPGGIGRLKAALELLVGNE